MPDPLIELPIHSHEVNSATCPRPEGVTSETQRFHVSTRAELRLVYLR